MSNLTGPLVEHFFRHESANLIAVLTRAFGIRRLPLIEDMVQAAMLEAMHAWKQRGIPDQPAAWFHRVAKNRILDALRRETLHQQAVALAGQSLDNEELIVDQWLEDVHLPDSLLRMMFVCCHPLLDRQSQIALTLKTLCGFGLHEISKGLLLRSETVKKRIQRARKTLAVANVSLELPGGDELVRRREVVHDVLYLLFNEGYSTSNGNEPIRDDICEEAARLCHLLCQSDVAAPSTRALLALQLFHAARLESRIDHGGEVILLDDQDRNRWDRCLIAEAKRWLSDSKDEFPSRFHLEAAISLQHCDAKSVAETNWQMIVRLYSRLIELHDSPVYRLNRAIALGQIGHLGQAMDELSKLRAQSRLNDYLLLDCAIARIHEMANRHEQAIDCYLTAMKKATASHQRSFLSRKLAELSGATRSE